MATLLDLQPDGTYTEGCGCGGKQKKVHTLLPDTKAVFVVGNGFKKGPVTGNDYFIYPNTTSLNIATADADAWLADGTAKDPIQGFKGHLTRTE